jgi:hypothetical protein
MNLLSKTVSGIWNFRNICISIILITGLLLGTALLPTNRVEAACDPPFVQVNENGFGSIYNLYTWSMKSFTNDRGDTHLYAATYAKWIGAQIWRYDGNNWQRVVRWGLNSLRNEGVRIMMDFNGALYAGVWNRTNGAQIWRTTNGVNWQAVVTGGFGNARNETIRTLREYNGWFYAGTQNTAGPGQLWRTQDGFNWEQVNLGTNFDPTSNSIHDMKVFNGQLYLATRNEVVGTQIYRTTEPGVNLEVVVGPGSRTPSGFGDASTVATMHMEVFKGALYIGTLNFARGFDMRRTFDGIDYEQVGQNGFGYGNCAAYAWRFGVLGDHLWMGGLNTCSGGTVWKTSDGVLWQQLVGQDSELDPPVLGGFGDESNWGIRSIEVYNNKIYFGTAECFFNDCSPYWDGTEIWEWQGECN